MPYRGSVPALTDVVSGQIQFMMVDLAVAIPMIQEGKMKAYGVTSPTRIKAMPDLPTIAEAGLPGYAATGWFSVGGTRRHAAADHRQAQRHADAPTSSGPKCRTGCRRLAIRPHDQHAG